MKKIYAATLLGTMLLATSALAQAPTAPSAAPPAGTTATFTLAPADATTFKTWVTAQKPVTVAVPAGFSVAVGAVVPMTVTLADIPATANVATLTKYKYVMLGSQVVLVDPATRKIVYIVM